MIVKRIFALCIFILLAAGAVAQSALDLYPKNWFTGMKWNQVQLLVHNNIEPFTSNRVIINHAGVVVREAKILENPRYMTLDLTIEPTANPGNVMIQFEGKKRKNIITWQLKPRRPGNGTVFAQGLNSSDFIYLLMPDRFSNGDPSNDKVEGYLDQTLNRDSIYHRHGGDLYGVANHVDYLKDLGVTALWMTPVLENDMPNRTEHGYAATDHYNIDKRLGGEAAYKKLSSVLHENGMKLVQDAVYNHTGSYHFAFKDMPFHDWVNEWPQYTNTTYKESTIFDPYGTQKDLKKMQDGWFVPTMPDLNHKNEIVANFLIQHALWSVEEFGIDAWRIDTYIYNDLEFMNRCNQALINDFPKITMFGETWVHGVINQAYFTQNILNTPFKSNLMAVTDFQTNLYGITKALTEPFGWTEGVSRLYNTLCQDIIYENPMNHVIFLDNHDMSRIASVVNNDENKVKMAISWLLTCRGIPQMYYGTEVFMKGITQPNDGYVRLDFPGGWQGDKTNAFTGEGLSDAQKAIQKHTKTLANFRKESEALKTGKLKQYLPNDGLYVYFRFTDNEAVMCVMNTSNKPKLIIFPEYDEVTSNYISAKDVQTGDIFELSNVMQAQPMSMVVLSLM